MVNLVKGYYSKSQILTSRPNRANSSNIELMLDDFFDHMNFQNCLKEYYVWVITWQILKIIFQLHFTNECFIRPPLVISSAIEETLCLLCVGTTGDKTGVSSNLYQPQTLEQPTWNCHHKVNTDEHTSSSTKQQKKKISWQKTGR